MKQKKPLPGLMGQFGFALLRTAHLGYTCIWVRAPMRAGKIISQHPLTVKEKSTITIDADLLDLRYVPGGWR